MKLRLPPHIKYLEAAGAIADGRVKILMHEEARAEATVVSSSGERSYNVIVEKHGDKIVNAYSDDNGTRYRGYIGYPIISLMMLIGWLPRDRSVEEALKGIPWKTLNEKYKKYAIVMEHVYRQAEERGVSRKRLEEFIQVMKSELAQYRVYYREWESKPSLADYM
ncbi:MAG: hypothetical protein GXO68_05580 [Crenarchaeota archaeon]|nr:hypothetical protein [Thermoproteota archaeon]